MLDLSLAILSSTGIAVVLRLSRQHGRNIETVIATNYVVAAAVGWSLLVASGRQLSAGRTTLLLGLAGGILWPGTFHIYSWGISTFGIARTGAWSRLSVGVPVLLGVSFLDETVDAQLLIGLALLIAALIALTPRTAPLTARPPANASTSSPNPLRYAVVLIVVFGVIDAWISIFNEIGSGDGELAFFVLLFTSAAVVSWTALAARRVAVNPSDVFTGGGLGVLNFGVSWFMLGAIGGSFENRTAVAFGLYSAASLLLIVVIGGVAWREQIRARELAGVVAAVAAIVALNP